MPEHSQLVLPEAPRELDGPVKAWEQPVLIETYEPERPEHNPMFLENRVYQGSSGQVYPLPFVERVARESHPKLWKALHIENEFLRIMILPELGGRIHVGFDKTNGYDFLYRQNVIKPALVGLAGPWASGGIELNWPQHHRPATYMPVQSRIEHHDDGSVTIWCSDHDPFDRMKGAHGVCLRPGKAVLELKVRLYNRTPLTHTFLWWANAATRVNEWYQSFFPPDVHFVADHAERAMSTYPFCSGVYYGIDYAERAASGIPARGLPPSFPPPGTYPPNDLRWYANIPVPTSYMALGSEADFMGGYDHQRGAGVIHVANHHIAPGKKQWTWGNQEFGYSWDRQLTDADGPYIELMAGVYTDNQPDFSFIGPGETKVFSQFWYPIQAIGIPHAANVNAAVHVERVAVSTLRVALYTTQAYDQLTIAALLDGNAIGSHSVDRTGPGVSVQVEFDLPGEQLIELYAVAVSDRDGTEILRYDPQADRGLGSPPAPASEPPPPSEVDSVEQLLLIAQHLEQYRHAVRDPQPYWLEILRRDPGESRCLEALALQHLRRGEFRDAESLLQRAVARVTTWNGNPASGSAFYHLGIVRRLLNKDDEAYSSLYKAAWNFAQRSAAHYALAQIDAARGRFADALAHLERALRTNADDLRARNLQAVLFAKLGRKTEAARCIADNEALDPTDAWTEYLLTGSLPRDNQLLLDVAFDYAKSGFFEEAAEICAQANSEAEDGSVPMICYSLAFFKHRRSQFAEAAEWLGKARSASAEFCFPNRLEEMLVLQWALEHDGSDGRASYYLGNLLYSKRRYEEAIAAWENSTRQPDALPTAWRNLGIAYFNVRKNSSLARNAYDQAFAENPHDARVFFERDQLWKRIGVAPNERLREMKCRQHLIEKRDDLTVELIALSNQHGRHEEALRLLSERTFQPWEGGEGLVIEQHVRTRVALGRHALLRGDNQLACDEFHAALKSPANLGEAKHPLANQSNIFFWLGETFQRMGQLPESAAWRLRAIAAENDFQDMSVQPFSAMSFYRVLSFQRIGREEEADRLLTALRGYIQHLDRVQPKVDYFATSLPNTLLFREDLARKQHLLSGFLKAQTQFASGKLSTGAAALRAILSEEPSHQAAADFLKESECLDQLGVLGAAAKRQSDVEPSVQGR